jgi:hypothetical protein
MPIHQTLEDEISGRIQKSAISIDAPYTTSALSALTRAHSEGFSLPLNAAGGPHGPCPACGSDQWWQLPGEPWHCRACEPGMLLTATILTLPCYKVELRPVAVQARLCTLFENACQGLMITPEQLRRELEENSDIPDLASGALTPKALRLTAKTLALMCCSPVSERLLKSAGEIQVMPRFYRGHSGNPTGTPKGACDKRTQLRERLVHYTLRH